MKANKIVSIFVISMMVVSGLGLFGIGDLISGVFTQSYSRSGDDSYEENDVSSAAATITVGTHGSLQCLDDDWYKIRLTAGTDLTVTIEFNHASGDLDLEVYASDRTTLMGRSHGTTNSELVELSQLAAHQVVANDIEGALENLLLIVQQDRAFGDDAARLALLRLFDMLGDDPMVTRYRARMFNLLH